MGKDKQMTDNDRELIEENRILRAMCLKLIGVYIGGDEGQSQPERIMRIFRRRFECD